MNEHFDPNGNEHRIGRDVISNDLILAGAVFGAITIGGSVAFAKLWGDGDAPMWSIAVSAVIALAAVVPLMWRLYTRRQQAESARLQAEHDAQEAEVQRKLKEMRRQR